MTEPRRPWRPPTLADVAARADVSKATASRVLAYAEGRSKSCPAAAGSVLTAMSDLGYLSGPADLPRLLVVVTDVSRTGYWATLSGVLAACQELGVGLAAHVLSHDTAHRRRALLTALEERVDGVVAVEFDSLSVAILSELPADLPLAVAGGAPDPDTDGLPRAWINDRAGACTAVRHLIELGHRRIAYVGVPPAGHPDPRVIGWRETLLAAGLPVLEPLATGWSVETGMRAAARARAVGATAVLCGNDDLAMGLISGLTTAGVRVPQDVSVVGMDDHPHAAAASPALTTVRLDFVGLGECATRLALGDLDGPLIEVPTELIIRQSTAPPSS
ncbi:substrate-binding domain-containing protein [Actinomyces sp.]|uniref:substrate-binding domain-containing protein n=1 Tax=Actinomyces sp. TaxID=29317 RepID=UPI0026DCB347|nr:substrate-binding domain-containing protein [Actinomyces sp.]MDO4901262.1 substrate-binding domain-containing protein [Actinomyces sp.]